MKENTINLILKKAKQDKEILAVALFGSAVKNKEHRDIDMCLFLNKRKSNLEMTQKKLDFLTEINNKIDIQIFQQLPIYIKIRIIKEGKILLCKEEKSLYEIAFDTIKEFDSFKKLYEMYLSNIGNG